MKYWTKSWNPITGCTPISEGCARCWAHSMVRRAPQLHGAPNMKTVTVPFGVIQGHGERVNQPFHWRKPQIVATCWLGDLFHENVPGGSIRCALDVIRQCPQHAFLLLTKRAERLVEFVFPGNAWVGVTVENQARADERLAYLAKAKTMHRWVSIEPILGEVWIASLYRTMLDWVVAGAETGPGARPADPAWFCSLRDQCRAAEVPFFVKALDARGNRVLEGGRIWSQYPKGMRP